MTRDAPAPIFHPFDAGEIDWPGKNTRLLVLGATPALRLPPELPEPVMAQGFRPDFLALERAGCNVLPQPEGEGYSVAFVLATKHRGQNEAWIAEAIRRVAGNGLVVVAGGKMEGVSSLRKRLGSAIPLGGHLAKSHGETFWFSHCEAAENWAALVALNLSKDVLVDGRFDTAPGMFSSDHIDVGSAILASHLPANLTGLAADFCAGWGYLAVTLAERSPGVTGIELFEADHASLGAAKTNMAALAPDLPASFHWIDLATEKVERRFDVIVMNPPFHQGRVAEPGIGHAMIRAASGALKAGGRLLMVANRGLPYEAALKAGFGRVEELADESGFKVWKARR